jgi:hypothetical protein
MKNPAFNNVGRAPYELGYLVKNIGEIGTDAVLTDSQRSQVGAAVTHAQNSTETLLSGLESIGKMLALIGPLEERVDGDVVTNIGELIAHLAVEVQYVRDVEDEMSGILSRDKAASAKKKGGAKRTVC